MQIEGRELNILGSSFSFIKFLLLLEKVAVCPTRRNPGPLCIATALITVNNQGFDLLKFKSNLKKIMTLTGFSVHCV